MGNFGASLAGGGGGGGGVLGLGPAQNTFGTDTTTNRAAAEALRNTYQGNNADWLTQYNENRSFWIRLQWDDGTVEQRRNVAGDDWEDVTNVIRGRTGPTGPASTTPGPQGNPGPQGVPGTAGGGVNWATPTSEATADLASATSSATAVDLGYDVDDTTNFFISAQFETTLNTDEDNAAVSFVDSSRLSTDNSLVIGLGQNDILFLRTDINDNLFGWRGGGDSGTYRIRIWELGAVGTPGGGADGVVQSGEISADGMTLTLTLSTGGTVEIDIPSILRTGGGGGLTQAQVQTLINNTNLSALQGMVTDGQIPAAIMRDAEFTAAAVRNLLSLTSIEVNDLLTGATLSGQTLTFTQNDGTTVPITLPAGTGGMADGVVASGAINAAGTELTLTLDTGGTVVVDIPAVLRSGMGAADGVVDGGSYANGTLTLERSVGDDITITGFPAGVPPVDHTTRGAISEDETLSTAEVNDGTTTDNEQVTMPTWASGRRFLYIGIPTDEDNITGIATGGIDVFHAWEAVTGTISGHKWWKTINSQSTAASGITYTISQG